MKETEWDSLDTGDIIEHKNFGLMKVHHIWFEQHVVLIFDVGFGEDICWASKIENPDFVSESKLIKKAESQQP